MAKRTIKLGKLVRFLVIVAIVAVVVVFHSQIAHAIYDTTGVTWFLSGNEKHELAAVKVNFKEVKRDPDFATPTDLPPAEPEKQDLSQKLNLPQGNNILGITYSAANATPEALGVQANTIYKIRITQIDTSAGGNMIYTEYQAKVKKVYRGQETKEINFSMMGGSLPADKLQPGYVANVAEKTKDKAGQTIHLVVDGQEPLQMDTEYILFAGNQNGIITPSTGRSSFFLIDKGKVKRNTMAGEQPFSMGLGTFEKKYLQ